MLTSSGKVDFSKSLYLALDRESSRDYTLSSPLSSAWYIFSVYDIEENGTVQGHIAYPAFSQNHFVMRNTQGWLRWDWRINNYYWHNIIICLHRVWATSYNSPVFWSWSLQCYIFSGFGDICTVCPLPWIPGDWLSGASPEEHSGQLTSEPAPCQREFWPHPCSDSGSGGGWRLSCDCVPNVWRHGDSGK